MYLSLFFLSFVSLLSAQSTCQHAGGPVSERTIINYLKNLVKPLIPYSVPSIQVEVSTGLIINASQIQVQTLDFSSATMQLSAPNTIYFQLKGLIASISLNWILQTSTSRQIGSAKLSVDSSGGSITALLQPDSFKNINATTFIGNINLSSTNQPVIEPYWDLLRPVLVDTLEREIPNLIMELNTSEVKSLVYPVVLSLEPISIAPINTTVFGIFGGFSNLLLQKITFSSATLAQGPDTNTILLEILELSGLITNNWEFSGFGLDEKGTGHIGLSGTSVGIVIEVSENSGEFYVNLNNAKIIVGGLDIHVDSGNSEVVNWLILQLEPLLVPVIEESFQTVVCILFNGIPNFGGFMVF